MFRFLGPIAEKHRNLEVMPGMAAGTVSNLPQAGRKHGRSVTSITFERPYRDHLKREETAMVVARAPMITPNPQPALKNVPASPVDQAVARTVEAKPDTAAHEAMEMTWEGFDDLLDDLPEDFNGILVY